jgi:hypothetical protein
MYSTIMIPDLIKKPLLSEYIALKYTSNYHLKMFERLYFIHILFIIFFQAEVDGLCG